MSATNRTTYYELPSFIGTDSPSWLGDWNNAMSAIDTAIHNAMTKGENALTKANSAQSATDANTQQLEATNGEIETIKKAVQNYDNILDFHVVNLAINPNNVVGEPGCFMTQNTNKTLNKIMVCAVLSQMTNPTSYVYTRENGTVTWYDLFTVEDNCLKLNQTSLPNYKNALTVGVMNQFSGESSHIFEGCVYLRAWYDGATTHFGFDTGRDISNIKGDILSGNFCVFTSGSVYNPDNPSL